jgi:hypothetical protein
MDLETTGHDSDSTRQDALASQDEGRADVVAIELVKQLITLAAGVLALSATFLEKVGSLSHTVLVFLAFAWLALVISVFGGLQAMSAIVKSRLDKNTDWSKGSGKKYASLSKYGFLLGILLFAAFAFILLATPSSQSLSFPTGGTTGFP